MIFFKIALFEDISSLGQQVIERQTPFPIEDNGSFKVAIGVTNHDFVLTANGQHFLRVPLEHETFLAQPVNFQISTCAGLEIEMQGVDVISMAEVDVPTKPQLTHSSSKTNMLLAQIYHH